MRTRVLVVIALGVFAASGAVLSSAGLSDTGVEVRQFDDRVRVEICGTILTEYVFQGALRPYLHPVLTADGMPLTRRFPLTRSAPPEEGDHPHHRSLWFTHGKVNGVDFWLEGATKGRIVSERVDASSNGEVGTIRARNRWVAPDGTSLLTDETELNFRATGDGRLLDYEVTLRAPADRAVVLGDTKEGSMAIRVAEWMAAPHRFNGKPGDSAGEIVNAEGARNGDAWAKRSRWVDYHAENRGKVYGIAMFDHPKNPRHPTWWHVRDYGLFAANPFGQHDFEPEHKADRHAGDLRIPAGESVTFRWRFYFHFGDEKTAKVAEHYQDFANGN